MDELEPQHAYDFFAPGPLPGYANNRNNMNGWIEAHVPLLGELGEMGEPLGAEVDKPLVDPVIDELAEPIVEVEEQMVAPAMNMEEDLAMLFGLEDDSSDDDFEGPEGDEEVWEVNEEWLMALVTLPLMPVMPPLSTYEVGGSFTYPPSTWSSCASVGDRGFMYPHGYSGVWSWAASEEGDHAMEQGQQAATQRDETIAGLSQHVQTLQAAVQDRDMQIQQLQTLVAEMSSREGTLMQCILGLDRCLADVERRPPGPQ
ncbi:hypothetical protein Tco_1579110 [Tanacetum coccineum]